MKRLTTILLMLLPMITMAQRLQVYEDGSDKYLALFAYGLPREVVKTNAEIKASKFGDTGIMRRHHTTKYVDEGIGTEGYSSNHKLTFGFIIAPYNVNANGQPVKDPNAWDQNIDWYAASGWDISTDSREESGVDAWNRPFTKNVNYICDDAIPNPSPTGCAKYQGISGNDPIGSWRLPTQREVLTMFTVMEQALELTEADEVEHLIVQGRYWTSTELLTSSSYRIYFLNSTLGITENDEKIAATGAPNTAFARCVRDIDNDPINEQ